MPRVNLLKNDKDIDIRTIIASRLVMHDMTVSELIKKCGMKKSSYFKARKNPELFKVRDLRNIYDALKVPEEERKGL